MSNAHLLSFSLRLPLTIFGVGSLAVMMADRVFDPVLLWFAPLTIPATIWLQVRREWLAAGRDISALVAEQQPDHNRPACPSPPLCAVTATRTNHRTLIVNYRKEMG